MGIEEMANSLKKTDESSVGKGLAYVVVFWILLLVIIGGTTLFFRALF